MPSVLWCCWLGGRKGIRSVKTEWWGAGMVICLERGADLNIAQLMPLPLTVSCYSKIQIGFTFWYWLTRVVPDKGPLNGCVCVSSCARDVLEFESKFKCCWNSVRQLWNLMDLQTCLCRTWTYVHHSSLSIVCTCRSKQMHIEWLFVDVCIILNAKLDRDMSSNSVFNIHRHR